MKLGYKVIKVEIKTILIFSVPKSKSKSNHVSNHGDLISSHVKDKNSIFEDMIF